MRSEERRRRTETNEAWVAGHPVAAWLIYALIFGAVSLLVELPDEDGVQWIRVVTIGPAVAVGVVLGTIFRHRRRQRSRQR